ncbi:REP-associated tyrosine transposase [Pseudomonas muyukensis]|uniref:Transposase n=1 Tax=Pseudomonas muyukensis TaxID=2842357 RepID=A0ABX8M8U9_9PSED|nr:transposase [Pseudomonas muyukensis]QXH35509.1 transposase [Pseudomonas muyukensis]
MNLAHAHHLRKGRYSKAGRVYIVTTVVTGREPLFQDFQLARTLVAQLRHAHDQQWVSSLCWVIMPDHLHWLIELRQIGLSNLMRRVKSRSSRFINAAANRQGRLWQKNFHDHALRKEHDLRATARYIVANPLRAGLVTTLRHYPHWDAIWL